MQIRQAAYLVAAAATAVGVGGGLVGFVEVIAGIGRIPTLFWAFAILSLVLAVAFLAFLVWAFLWMARKPRLWGKFLCFVGLPWIGFSTMSLVAMPPGLPSFVSPLMMLPGAAGVTLLVAFAVLIVVDGGRLVSEA